MAIAPKFLEMKRPSPFEILLKDIDISLALSSAVSNIFFSTFLLYWMRSRSLVLWSLTSIRSGEGRIAWSSLPACILLIIGRKHFETAYINLTRSSTNQMMSEVVGNIYVTVLVDWGGIRGRKVEIVHSAINNWFTVISTFKGLKKGDEIISINEIRLETFTHHEKIFANSESGELEFIFPLSVRRSTHNDKKINRGI